MKTCDKCIWRDVCRCEDVCDDYSPAEESDEEQDILNTYENDLKERHQEYLALIQEQDQ